MKFTADEMNHPSAGLSGGQKAKLMFLMMAEIGANVLLLDEPTRNLSPLSGPVIRELLAEYPGCIITVSHEWSVSGEIYPKIIDKWKKMDKMKGVKPKKGAHRYEGYRH